MKERKSESPYTLFLERIPTDIKRVLLNESPLTPNIISTRTGYNWRTVKKYLDVMAREGIVKEQRVGRLFLYTLDEGVQR
ncbi:MAG: helix-turn-helix transcriptional regulator [Proteobacteria bacterium]|nr:helix-turn-helix transcriptional regulator [Pseudomonadota bacterium]